MAMHLKKQPNKCPKANHESGFSLLEVIIVMAVIGVLAAPLLQQYNINQARKIAKESSENLALVRSALQRYAVNQGRYPFPADKNIGAEDSGYGAESTTTPIPACTSASETICRTTSGSLGSAGVLIGTVPFAALGLPEQYTFDGYKRKFTYAVTEALTGLPSAFNDGGGVIALRDRTGGNRDGTTSNVHFVVVSHGLDGKGASTASGVIPFACTATTADDENCNNDAIFNSNFDWVGPAGNQIYSRLEFGVDGNTHYDDYVEYTTSTTSEIWTLNTNAANADVYKRNSNGNIKIGDWGTTGLITKEVVIKPAVGAIPAIMSVKAPDAKVDVAGDASSPGNVIAQRLFTNRLCTFTENAGVTAYVGCVATGTGTPPAKSFTPSIIGGDIDPTNTATQSAGNGINCGKGGAMTGIANADEICRPNTAPAGTITIDASCVGAAGGQRIENGILYCVLP